MQQKTRNIELDCMKGVLILFVVFRHVLQCASSDTGGIIGNIIWAIQMPGFMIISGYLAYKGQDISKSTFFKSLLKNAYRYALPFFSWFVLVDVILLKEYAGIGEGLKRLVFSVDNGLWFLWVIFVLSEVAATLNYFLSKCSSKKGMVLTIVAIGSIVVGISLTLVNFISLNFLGIKLIVYYALFYFLGYMLRFWKINGNMVINKVTEEILICVASIVFLLIICNVDLFMVSDTLSGIAVRVVAALSGFYLLLKLVKKCLVVLTKCKMGYLGRYTLEIYCVHVYISGLMKIDKVNSFYSVNGFLNVAIGMLLVSVLTAIIIVVLKQSMVMNLCLFGKKDIISLSKNVADR